MHAAAIAQLMVSAETCENNAPIHLAEGNQEQAVACATNAVAYRQAITALEGTGLARPNNDG